LHIFIDRSVLEVFANETVCVTKVISPLDAEAILQIRADSGTANARVVEAWPLKRYVIGSRFPPLGAFSSPNSA